jgi:GTP-binding protein
LTDVTPWRPFICEMGFLDEVVITARSGDGGRGCVSFRREKYIPKGGPDGGDGGDGGKITIVCTGRLNSFANFKEKRQFKAENGENGKGKNRSGKNGADVALEVPLGTVIEDSDTGEVLADLTIDGHQVLLIPGGKGGKGNQHFASPTNRAPRIAQAGRPGQEKRLKLSLKFIADIGIIGLPNAGKSSLLSRLSMAHPKVDSYPFTTLTPNLGVMTCDDEASLIVADIPGLIEGASQGRGLGLRFLKHIERTRLLLHLLDITFVPDRGILEDFHTVMEEMEAYHPGLIQKPQLVLINKIDLCGPGQRELGQLRRALADAGMPCLAISALTGDGVEELKTVINLLMPGPRSLNKVPDGLLDKRIL